MSAGFVGYLAAGFVLILFGLVWGVGSVSLGTFSTSTSAGSDLVYSPFAIFLAAVFVGLGGIFVFRAGQVRTAVAKETTGPMTRRSWAIRAALVVTGITIALSVFLLVIGPPAAEASVTRACSTGSRCIETSTFSNFFVPTPAAAIPLLAAVAVALGVVSRRIIISWAGTIFLLVFSFVALFSIGLLYAPFALMLVGLLAAVPAAAKDPLAQQ